MCLCRPKEKVAIKKMVGYVFALKTNDGTYLPYYNMHFEYELGKKYRAMNAEPHRPMKKNYREGGFYFFHTKKALVYWANIIVADRNAFTVVGLKCEFEDVFEKGKWGHYTAYRAMHRTILEEVEIFQ